MSFGQYTRHIAPKFATQKEKIKPEQVKNSAGGYVFKLDPWKQLERFLILGTEGGTYYASEKKLTKENAGLIQALLQKDAYKVIQTIAEISDTGRAPKNDPAIFALAVAASDPDLFTRALALEELQKVCRIPTHLFHFAQYCDDLRGWGKGLRKAVGSWYNDKEPKRLAEFLVKYQQRDGWSHRDLLRLAHPKPGSGTHGFLFNYAVKGAPEGALEINASENVAIIEGFERIKRATCATQAAELVGKYNLTREMVPTQFLNDAKVWDVLLQTMPPEALIRNLGKMTNVGLIKPLSDASKLISQKLHDKDHLRKARIHPFKVLVALKTYQNGHGDKGNLSWSPEPVVVEALEDAFYLSFGNVQPTGKKTLIAIDVSSSMEGGRAGGLPITPAEAAAAMAMVFAKTESEYYVMGYADIFKDLKISAKDSLEAVLKKTTRMNFGATDCALPYVWGIKNKIRFETVINLTDSETWAGSLHPSLALGRYRQEFGPTKQVVVGMTATGFTIADPADLDSLDVVGMDTSVPSVVGDFVRG